LIGISLCHNKANISAHFYSTDDSISCIVLIVKNGRACLENNINIFKFLLVISIGQGSAANFIKWMNYEFTENQYLLFDLFCTLIPSILMAK